MCGNGIVEYEEECDDGNSVDEDHCLSDCRAAACGDGVLHTGFEECDGSDNCSDNCKLLAFCGDGAMQGDEQCDDGNANDADSCSSECLEQRVVFVTSAQYAPGFEFDGVESADARCQQMAENANLAGEYRAWLSDKSNLLDERFDTGFMGRYVLSDGSVIAEGWYDLIDGHIDAPISISENGLPIDGDDLVWTGANAYGEVSLNSCGQWSSLIADGQVGNANESDYSWTEYKELPCSEHARLYCFEDV